MNLPLAIQKQFIKLFCYNNRSVRISTEKIISNRWIDVERIFEFQYIHINQKYNNWLHVDIDFPADSLPADNAKFVDPFFYDKLFLPRPNIAVFNTNGIHLFWHLKTAVAQNDKQIGFYTDIRNRIIAMLGGDHQCRAYNLVAKNPFWKKLEDREGKGEAFFFTTNNYSLYDFVTFLRETPAYRKPCCKRSSSDKGFQKGNRNADMFNYLVRQYKIVPSMKKEELVNSGLEYQTTFSNVPPLETSEVEGIASSIIDNNYKPLRNIGKMNLPEINATSRKEQKKKTAEYQRLGALDTAQEKTNNTIKKIEHAISLLKKENQKITAKAIALNIKMSERTVRKYIKVQRGVVIWHKEKSGS